MIGISKQLLQRTTSSLFKLVERSLSTHKVYRNGTGNFVQDLAQAVTRTKKGGEPNFMVVIASNYRLDHVTDKALEEAVKGAHITCPVIGCQGRYIESEYIPFPLPEYKPHLTVWSYIAEAGEDCDAFAFTSDQSVPNLSDWSENAEHNIETLIQQTKQPYTLTLSTRNFALGKLNKALSTIFDETLHASAIPESPTQIFVANANFKGENRFQVLARGAVGLVVTGTQIDCQSWLGLSKEILSEHWFRDIICNQLFVPKNIRTNGVLPSTPYQKYFLETQSDNIPMFPIKGAMLFPTTSISLRIFEPRYRAMIKECVERKTPFGLLPDDNTGTMAMVESIETMDATGESVVTIKGLRRFQASKLQAAPQSFGLNYGTATFYDDESPVFEKEEGDAGADESELTLLQRRARLFLNSNEEMSAHDVSMLLAQMTPAPIGVKMRWLKSMSTSDRLHETMDYLEALLKQNKISDIKKGDEEW